MQATGLGKKDERESLVFSESPCDTGVQSIRRRARLVRQSAGTASSAQSGAAVILSVEA